MAKAIYKIALFLFLIYPAGSVLAFDPANDNITCSGSGGTCFLNQLSDENTYLFYWDPHEQGLLCGADFTLFRVGSPSDEVLVKLYATGYASQNIDNINDLSILVKEWTLYPMTLHKGGISNGTNLGLSPVHFDLSEYLCTTVDDKLVFTFQRSGARDTSNYVDIVSYNGSGEVGNWTAMYADTEPADNDGQIRFLNWPAVVNMTNNVGEIDPLIYQGYFQKPATSSFDDTNQGFFQWLFTPSKQSIDQFGGLYNQIRSKPPFGYWELIKADFDNMAYASGSVSIDKTGFESIFDPVYAGISSVLWVMFGVYLIKRFVHFEF